MIEMALWMILGFGWLALGSIGVEGQRQARQD